MLKIVLGRIIKSAIGKKSCCMLAEILKIIVQCTARNIQFISSFVRIFVTGLRDTALKLFVTAGALIRFNIANFVADFLNNSGNSPHIVVFFLYIIRHHFVAVT